MKQRFGVLYGELFNIGLKEFLLVDKFPFLGYSNLQCKH